VLCGIEEIPLLRFQIRQARTRLRPSQLNKCGRKVAILPSKIPTSGRPSGPSWTNQELPQPALEPPSSNLQGWYISRISLRIKFSMETSTRILTLKLSSGHDFWGLASTFPNPKTKVVDNPKRGGLQVVGRLNSIGMAQGTPNTLKTHVRGIRFRSLPWRRNASTVKREMKLRPASTTY
jgi:hypothetical protein